MIPKSSKFPTRAQFLQFRAIAKQSTTPHLRVMTSPRAPSAAAGGVGTRLSVIVPIKVSKRATTRNSFKRLAYDAAWKILQNKSLDCIIMFKPIALAKGPESEKIVLAELRGVNF